MHQEPKPIRAESFGEVPDYFEPQSSRYLVRNSTGRWLPLTEAGYKRHLRARGLKSKPDEGTTLSDIDAAILEVQDRRDVSHYGPICGQNAGLLEVNGQRILVTEDMRLPEPAAGKWKNLESILRGLLLGGELPEIGARQLATFHGWARSSVEALLAGKSQQQQVLALCGPPGSGKSFLQSIITYLLGGRGAKAERYFSGKTPFNADLYAVEHLILEDEYCSTRIDQRLKLGAALKQHTVSTNLGSLHAKGRNAVNLPGWWRVSITLNDDPEAMMVLPPLDRHIKDKIILLRASSFEWPMSMQTTEQRVRFHDQIISEIPAYLHWLLHEWEMPGEVSDPHRYNVATFHHPELAEALHCFSPEAELHELLGIAYADRIGRGLTIEASASEIEDQLRRAAPQRAERLFSFRNACGTYLGRLASLHSEHLEAKRDESRRWWIIRPSLFTEN
jgi:hypothetical protein